MDAVSVREITWKNERLQLFLDGADGMKIRYYFAVPEGYALKEVDAVGGKFALDKPVCLYKGIWHNVLALTDEAQVKIAENLEVSSEFYDLEKEVSVKVVA